jgi:hypothetical protein
MDNTSIDLPSRPELVPNPKCKGPHENEEPTRRKRKRKRKKTSNITNEAVNKEDVVMNEEEEPATAQDSYPGLSSTQDLLGEPGKMLRPLLLPHLVETPLDRLPIFPMAILRNARTDFNRSNRPNPFVTARDIRTRREPATLAESRINHRHC